LQNARARRRRSVLAVATVLLTAVLVATSWVLGPDPTAHDTPDVPIDAGRDPETERVPRADTVPEHLAEALPPVMSDTGAEEAAPPLTVLVRDAVSGAPLPTVSSR